MEIKLHYCTLCYLMLFLASDNYNLCQGRLFGRYVACIDPNNAILHPDKDSTEDEEISLCAPGASGFDSSRISNILSGKSNLRLKYDPEKYINKVYSSADCFRKIVAKCFPSDIREELFKRGIWRKHHKYLNNDQYYQFGDKPGYYLEEHRFDNNTDDIMMSVSRDWINNTLSDLGLLHKSKVKEGTFEDSMIALYMGKAWILCESECTIIPLSDSTIMRCSFVKTKEKTVGLKRKTYYYYDIHFRNYNACRIRISEKYRNALVKYTTIS